MRLFAVILASIAALAATAQAYLSWYYLEKLENRWLFGSVEGRKRLACSQLVSATTKYQRLSKNVDGYYSAVLQEQASRFSRYQNDERGEELEKQAAVEARAAVLCRFRREANTFFDFLDEDHLYFTKEEKSALGYETFLEMPSDLDDYISRFDASTLTNSEDAFRKALEVVQRIGDLHPKVVEVCKPILLD
ncbi:hypothetical protein [Hyphococcus sp.]|uniref:hypothetical protein n=1 Tax=Hyphococcus sp. TaxID=2038636 RepID=UPI003D0EB14B